ACAFAMTSPPTCLPSARPAWSPWSKWMPPYWREMPAWSAAEEYVGHDRVTGADGAMPGSIRELPTFAVKELPKVSLPVNCCRTVAPAALNVLWPDGYSANGGVMIVGSW